MKPFYLHSTSLAQYLASAGPPGDAGPWSWPEDALERLAQVQTLEGARPIEIEVGAGKGEFLCAAAQERPDRLFVGLEWQKGRFDTIVKRATNLGLANVLAARADAHWFLGQHVKSGALDAVHVYFPDPWPKRRHHKRRLVNTSFLALVADRLKGGGSFQLITDHAPYLEWTCEQLVELGFAFASLIGEGAVLAAMESVTTKFYRLTQKAGVGPAGVRWVKPV